MNGLKPVERITLPMHWPAGHDSKARLTRRFGRPGSEIVVASYRLELLRVPGLSSLSLNGREIEIREVQEDNLVVDLVEPLLDRNILELEVEVGPEASTGDDGWGAIALVIVPNGPGR